MNRRIVIGAAVALAAGLLAGYFVYQQVQRAGEVEPVVAKEVVVAAIALPVGTRLEAQHLRTISWPADEPLPGMFTRPEECVGRALLGPVVENELILESKLAPREAGAGLAATLPEGMRALSVKVDEVIGVAGFVLPYTVVDVLVTGSLGGGRGSDNTVTHTILENIRVLAAGQTIEQDREGKPQKVSVVTLMVTPEEANKLTLASTQGRIQLALRNTIDTEETHPAQFHWSSMFGSPPRRRAGGPPARVITPPPPYEVEVIRGEKRERKAFTNSNP